MESITKTLYSFCSLQHEYTTFNFITVNNPKYIYMFSCNFSFSSPTNVEKSFCDVLCFCTGHFVKALKLDMSTLFTTIFLWISLQFILPGGIHNRIGKKLLFRCQRTKDLWSPSTSSTKPCSSKRLPSEIQEQSLSKFINKMVYINLY